MLIGHVNTLNTQAKLEKYKAKNLSLVLYAVYILIPWFKWEFFKDRLTQAELDYIRIIIRDLWSIKYILFIPIMRSKMKGALKRL